MRAPRYVCTRGRSATQTLIYGEFAFAKLWFVNAAARIRVEQMQQMHGNVNDKTAAELNKYEIDNVNTKQR